MYQRILIAADGSPISDTAVREAARLAHTLGARLRIVHVVDTVAFSHDSEFDNLDDISAPLREIGAGVLDRAVAIAREAGVEAETHLVELDQLGTRLDEAITSDAEHWNADLIVVGSHGRRGVRHWILGSVAERVMRTSERPVLLIHARTNSA